MRVTEEFEGGNDLVSAVGLETTEAEEKQQQQQQKTNIWIAIIGQCSFQ